MSTSAAFESLYQEDLYLLPSRTLVVLDKGWSEYNEPEQLLLSKILGSVKLTLAGVQILTMQTLTTESIASFSVKQVIAFGTSFGTVKKYESVQQNGLSVVVADGLEQLDDVRKKNLWIALKQMFAI